MRGKKIRFGKQHAPKHPVPGRGYSEEKQRYFFAFALALRFLAGFLADFLPSATPSL